MQSYEDVVDWGGGDGEAVGEDGKIKYERMVYRNSYQAHKVKSPLDNLVISDSMDV
jgi:hypothetical protein